MPSNSLTYNTRYRIKHTIAANVNCPLVRRCVCFSKICFARKNGRVQNIYNIHGKRKISKNLKTANAVFFNVPFFSILKINSAKKVEKS